MNENIEDLPTSVSLKEIMQALGYLFVFGCGLGFWSSFMIVLNTATELTVQRVFLTSVGAGFVFVLAPFLSRTPEEGVTKNDIVSAKFLAKTGILMPWCMMKGLVIGGRRILRFLCPQKV